MFLYLLERRLIKGDEPQSKIIVRMSNQTDKPRLCKKRKSCQVVADVVSKSDTNTDDISESQTKIAKQFTCDSNSQKEEGNVHNAKLSKEIGGNKE